MREENITVSGRNKSRPALLKVCRVFCVAHSGIFKCTSSENYIIESFSDWRGGGLSCGESTMVGVLSRSVDYGGHDVLVCVSVEGGEKRAGFILYLFIFCLLTLMSMAKSNTNY